MRGLLKHSEALLYPLFLLLGLLAAFHPTVLSGLSLMQTDPGDTRVFNYILEHSFQWLQGNPLYSSFWSPPIFYPAVNTAAYQDILLGSAPLYWLFRLSGFLPDTSLQLWMMGVLTLDYLAALWLLRIVMRLSVSASIAGSYLFAFAGIRISQCGHQQLFPQFFSVVAIISLFKIFAGTTTGTKSAEDGNGFWVVLFAGSIVLQLYAGIYLGWFFCLGLLVCFMVAVVYGKTRGEIVHVARTHAGTIVLAVFLSAAALSWMGYHYYEGFSQVGGRTWEETATMIPRLKSWLNMSPDNWVYGWTRHFIDFSVTNMEHEHRIGLGIVTLGMCLAGLVRMAKETWGKVMVISTIIIVLVALMYPYDWSPWKLVWKSVPAAGAIRAVTRIALLLLIPLSIAVALYVHHLKSRVLTVAALLILCLEQGQTTLAFEKNVIRRRVASIASMIPQGSQAFYYAPQVTSFVKPRPLWENQLDTMWAQMIAGVPTINGYSANLPAGWAPLNDLVQRSQWDAARIREAVDRWIKQNNVPLEGISVVGNSDSLPYFFLDFGTPEARRFLGEGWSGDEANNEFSFVWATGQQASITVPLKAATTYLMKLMAQPFEPPGYTQKVSVTLNGRTIAQFRMTAGMKTYQVRIPAKFVQSRNEIRFLFAYAVSPASVGRSSDSRDLSVAFSGIRFSVSDVHEN